MFIIDECHRSQFGEMHTAINKHFINAQYFGFTGTPRFKENKSQDGRTTADIFDKCLHTYLIKDAIKDENVLGFSVEYIKTFDGEVNEFDDEKVRAIDKEEVFMADERIDMITNHIIKNHNNKTAGRKFCSIFTVQSIKALIKYYDAFKKINHDLKIAGVYTFQDNEDLSGKDEHSRDSLERIISDYNSLYPEENLDYSTDTFQGYFKDLSNRMKKGDIDIVLVVNMFLTGFDSKLLNTLYVDKNLQYHGLLQAFSRTNRIYDISKPYGNIVCYRNLKKDTDDAICLFSNTDNTDVVLMQDYQHYINLFKEKLNELYIIAPTVEAVDYIEDENIKKAFVIAFRELTKQLIKLKTFTEFDFDEEEIGMNAQTYEDYKSKYLSIYDKVKKSDAVSIIADIDFCIELMQTDKINVSYIFNLIRNIDFKTKDKVRADVIKIKKLIDNADNENLRLKADILREFLDKVVPKATINDDITELFDDFIVDKKADEIIEFSKDVNVAESDLKGFIAEYEYSNLMDIAKIRDSISGSFLTKRKLTEKIKSFILNHISKFTF